MKSVGYIEFNLSWFNFLNSMADFSFGPPLLPSLPPPPTSL